MFFGFLNCNKFGTVLNENLSVQKARDTKERVRVPSQPIHSSDYVLALSLLPVKVTTFTLFSVISFLNYWDKPTIGGYPKKENLH